MTITSKRVLVALVAALSIVVGSAGSASAHAWRTPYDKDNIDRSTPSQKAYTTGGVFSWQKEHVHRPSLQVEDYKASFRLKLAVNGSKKSCGQFKITTYKRKNKAGSPSAVSKKFPSSGYYKYCPASGKGSKAYSGADRLDVGQNSYYTRFDRAVIRICWTRSTSVPTGGDCYQFTIRSGD